MEWPSDAEVASCEVDLNLEVDELEGVPDEDEELEEETNSDWLNDWEKLPSLGKNAAVDLDKLFQIPQSKNVPFIPQHEMDTTNVNLMPGTEGFVEGIEAIAKRVPEREHVPTKWLMNLTPPDKHTGFAPTIEMWKAIIDVEGKIQIKCFRISL